MTANSTNSARRPRYSLLGFIRSTWKLTQRLILLFLGLIGCYAVIVLVGLIPVNSEFEETAGGVEIFVFSGPFHSDLILPIENSVFDWQTEIPTKHFQFGAPSGTHVAFGWGDKDFYIHTPSWTDLKFSTACEALLVPSDTVMHVSHLTRPTVSDQVRRVTISNEQYSKLVEFIRESFLMNDVGSYRAIPGQSYGENDAFFEGSGSYHGFRTCNCWVGNGLERAGVKTGWFTPLPKTVFLYLPE